MDQIDETRSPKRKPGEELEDQPLEKKICSNINIEIEPANNILDNNDNKPFSIKQNHNDLEDFIRKKDEKDNNNVELSTVQDSNFDIQPKEEFITCHENEDSELIKDNSKDNAKEESELDCKKESNNELNLEIKDDLNEDNHNSESRSLEENPVSTSSNTNNDTDNNQATATTNVQSVPRIKCKYGSQCYRLNTEHKAEFSHPGDADYDAPDNRPECPYGLGCYRKNLQHKLDYKHTRSKRKPTQTVVRPTSPQDLSDWEIDSMEESVDESDYDPSFIDDDSIDEFESDFDTGDEEN